MTRNFSRAALAAVTILLLVPLLAHAQSMAQFDLPSQPLAASLRALGSQTSTNVLFDPPLVEGLHAPALKAELTLSQAFAQLLAGTGLKHRFLDDKTVMVVSAKDQAVRPTTAVAGSAATQLAQAEPLRSADPTGATGAAPSPATDAPGKEFETEVIVTGSRLRGRDDTGAAPVVVFDRQTIDRLGVTSVSDVLEYLPQQTFSAEEGFGFAGSRSVQLRGLAPGTTLVLINGRRTVTSALNAARNSFDMNSIPLAAVERVEVLSDSASAVYGADAVGGVVNIILKSGLGRPVADVYYGTADGGGDERRASLSMGHSAERWRGTLVLDHFDRNMLPGTEREFYADRDFRRFGGPDRRVNTTNPANICSADGSPLTGLATPCAAVPVGSTGVGLTPADFAATAGQTHLQTTSGYGFALSGAERRSAFANGEFDITAGLTAFAELLYTDREEVRSFAPPTINNTSIVPASNPFNPFGEAVRVRYLLEGLGTQYTTSEIDFRRGVAGLKGEIGSWDWELAALMTDDEGKDSRSYVLNTPRLTEALNSTDPATAFNMFQDGPGGSPELLAQLRMPDPTPILTSASALQWSGFMRGSVGSVPAGPIETVIGAEARDEEIDFRGTGGVIVVEARKSSSAFAEMRVPVVGDAMDVPLARRVDVTLAGRYDEYDDFGGTFNPQYGIEWSPVPQLLLRASYGESFRAPSLIELHQPLAPFTTTSFDPRRNETTSGIILLSGGNDQLEPEISDSLTVGFVLTPGGPASRLRVKASYWRVEQEQRVQRLQPHTVLANEALFPERVVRNPPTPLDIAAGRPGTIREIITTAMNFGSLKTDGVDFEISDVFDTRLGRFTPSVATTWIHDFEAADVPSAPPLDRVGIASLVQGSIVSWKGRATLGWDYRGIGLTTVARYTSSYRDADTLGTPRPRMLPSQTLVDLQASMDFGQRFEQQSGWLSGLVLRLGVVNLFDKGPSYSDSGGLGYDTYQSDIRQRFGYVSLSKAF